MLSPVYQEDRSRAPLAGQEPPSTEFDWDARLSIDSIRQHTKTDDTPGVTDGQLSLYRGAAIEAAELYTGFLLSGQRSVTEPIPLPKRGRSKFRHKLRYPVSGGPVYLYGTGSTFRINVVPGTQSIDIPNMTGVFDLTSCCDPCATESTQGMVATYQAGFPSLSAVPAGIILGMLQFIAWLVEHPGDEYLTTRNSLDGTSGGAKGNSNVAFISGALETWRAYDPEAI